jgi:CBS domain-containing protein
MTKAYEVMTRVLATCAPDTSVSHVAAIMRDRDIGDVLVVENGKLHGIVTDRDLALKALTGEDDPLQTPVSKFMSTKIITGEAEWNLEQVAKVMGQHQIRRLPIVQHGQLVGIVSLGDVAIHAVRKDIVKQSLQAISTPVEISASGYAGHGGAWFSVLLVALASAMAWLTWNQSGHALSKEIMKSDLYQTVRQAVQDAAESIRKEVS